MTDAVRSTPLPSTSPVNAAEPTVKESPGAKYRVKSMSSPVFAVIWFGYSKRTSEAPVKLSAFGARNVCPFTASDRVTL